MIKRSMKAAFVISLSAMLVGGCGVMNNNNLTPGTNDTGGNLTNFQFGSRLNQQSNTQTRQQTNHTNSNGNNSLVRTHLNISYPEYMKATTSSESKHLFSSTNNQGNSRGMRQQSEGVGMSNEKIQMLSEQMQKAANLKIREYNMSGTGGMQSGKDYSLGHSMRQGHSSR